MQGMQNALDDVARAMPASKTAKPKQFVDLRFLQQRKKSGVFVAMPLSDPFPLDGGRLG